MPSYRTLLVLALAAFTVTTVLAAEAATQPLKKNEGRASSQLELVERGTEPAISKRKLGWKMQTLLASSMAVNGLFAWSLVSNYKANKAAEKQAQHEAATPPSSAGNTPQQNNGYPPQQNNGYPPGYSQPQTYGNPPGYYPTQQTSTGQSTNPPSTNNGPNSRREERPLARKFGRRSPVDIPKAGSFSDNVRRTSSDLDLLNRADLGEALGLFSRMLDRLD